MTVPTGGNVSTSCKMASTDNFEVPCSYQTFPYGSTVRQVLKFLFLRLFKYTSEISHLIRGSSFQVVSLGYLHLTTSIVFGRFS